jgi:hypothetical protein
MKNLLRSPRALAILAVGVVLAAVAMHYAARQQVVLVTFDGPWAFAPDPNDTGSIFAFAPKTESHHDLVVSSSGQSTTLTAGIYEMALPGARGGGLRIGPNILQTKIDAQGVHHALNAQFARYAVRLPKPEAYLAASTGRLRVGPAPYPPGPATENNYAMSVSLRYRAASLKGFALSGSPDGGGPFQRVPLENTSLSFMIHPLTPVTDECEMHVREAFRDLAKLVNVTIYVDIVGAPDECHDSDPQKPPA